MKLDEFLGRSPDELSRKQRSRLAGMWIATELYSPRTLPMRFIEAVGTTPEECVRMLRARGRDPLRFEMTPFRFP
jgi:hypothetical protein